MMENNESTTCIRNTERIQHDSYNRSNFVKVLRRIRKHIINNGVNLNMNLIATEYPSHHRPLLDPKILQHRREQIFRKVLD